mgnify:CR=1 FL=1
MKLVTWNCGGSFRTKYKNLERYDADIWIIQECEDPSHYPGSDFCRGFQQYLWIGDNRHKGLGVFACKGQGLDPLDWSELYQDHKLRYFLPCLLDQNLRILAVWANFNNSPTFGYIGQFWKYIQTNGHNFQNIIIAGDFNSNVRWDRWDRWWNHSDVIRLLEDRGIVSLYHKFALEEQGQESRPTFFLHRNPDKPYHIDYCFASRDIAELGRTMEIGSFSDWRQLSDHCPIYVELSL